MVTPRTFPRRMTVYTPMLRDEAAVELLAVYARLQSSTVTVPHGTATATSQMGRDRFYWELLKIYAPHWAGMIFGFQHGPVPLRDLARSCIDRVERALRAKDLLAGAIYFDRGRNGVLDAALHFDAWTWTLRAAYDSFATLLARHYELREDPLDGTDAPTA